MRSFSLGAFVCFVFLFFGCTNGYERYETSKNWQKQHLLPITEEAPSSFPHSIWIAPDDRTGDILINKIHSAKRKISLNVYLLSDERLIDTLIESHRNQILVRIILERSVYANPKGNTSVFARLKHEGVAVIWADEVQQNFNHAKYLIVDDFVFVSTGNFTNASFYKNREFLVGTSDASIVSFMDALFDADYNKFPFRSTHPSLYISPIDARKKIEYYLKNAKKHIRVYAVSFSDEQLLVLLESLSASGVRVYVCLAYEKSSERSSFAKRMQSQNISLHQTKSPFLHAKTMEIDDQILLIGSQNFTKNSLDQNREIGLIMYNSGFEKKYREVIMKDCRDG